ncbi:hypothetical protein, partial [Xenorhabdus lircayensis]
MDWGAFLTTNEGVPWWTPKTTPLSFVRKETRSVGRYLTRIDTHLSVGQPCMAFICAHGQGGRDGPYCELTGGDKLWRIELIAADAKYPVLCDIYIFTLVYPQPVPEWGIAIWDEAGQCVLTSDTKPLAMEGEYRTTQTLKVRGKKAILMQTTGWLSSTIDSPDSPMKQYRNTSFSAVFNGQDTQFIPAAVSGSTAL